MLLTFYALLASCAIAGPDGDKPELDPKFVAATRVSIVEGRWHLNGEITYRGARAEGLLLNVRMVNAMFEDGNRPAFDAEANTDAFIAHIPDYVAHGVLAFTLNLQGGMPGYEGAANSAFNPDGSLRASYLKRVQRVIEACDRHGAVVILGCYYQRQDQVLEDDEAVRAGVVNVAKWIQACGFRNVVLEIANEFGHSGLITSFSRPPMAWLRSFNWRSKPRPVCLCPPAGWETARSKNASLRPVTFCSSTSTRLVWRTFRVELPP